jgi:hypothetical protein
MKIKIFSCHHVVAAHQLNTHLYQSLVSGLELPANATSWTDIGGINISKRQKFCELRHQYYVWKNLLSDYDYVGFEHYRRMFYFDPWPMPQTKAIGPELAGIRESLALGSDTTEIDLNSATLFQNLINMRRSFSDEDHGKIYSYINDHDLIFVKPIMMKIRDNFVESHANALELWDFTMPVLKRSWDRVFPSSYMEPPAAWSGYLNMYIMRAEYFHEYMSWIFPVLEEMDERYPDAPARVWGHISERLLGSYIVHKNLERPDFRSKAVPHLTFSRDACG